MLESLRADYIRQLSYELRTPLNTVLGFAESLCGNEGAVLDGERYERIEAIVEGAYALKAVIDGMLAGLMEQETSPQETSPQEATSKDEETPPQGDDRHKASG
jgi:K+-sensing histidine kinase KdpD